MRANFDDATTASFGALASSVNFSTLKSQFQKILNGYNLTQYASPSMADINQALLNAGATLPPAATLVAQGVSDAVSEAASVGFSTLKYVAIIAVVGVGVYIAWQAGLLKNAIPRRA